MKASYAVVWSENGSTHAGKLELVADGVRLEGADGDLAVPFSDVVALRVGREGRDRIDGRPALVIERWSGEPIRVSTIGEVGTLLELADGIAQGQPSPASGRLVVVAPLRRRVREQVKALLSQGPPFAPDEVGLASHHVFLTSREAVFLFEAAPGARLPEQLMRDPRLWKAAAAWRGFLAGPPRLAEAVWTWAQDSSSPCSSA
jgi:hypothetical protein